MDCTVWSVCVFNLIDWDKFLENYIMKLCVIWGYFQLDWDPSWVGTNSRINLDLIKIWLIGIEDFFNYYFRIDINWKFGTFFLMFPLELCSLNGPGSTPTVSRAVRQAAASFKSLGGLVSKIKLAYTMLTLPPWQRYHLIIFLVSCEWMNIHIIFLSLMESDIVYMYHQLEHHCKLLFNPVHQTFCWLSRPAGTESLLHGWASFLYQNIWWPFWTWRWVV